MAQPPERLMRFYGNYKHVLEVLGFKEITFIHTSLMNDPFDPQLKFATDFNENYSVLIDYISKNHPENLATINNALSGEEWISFIRRVNESFTQYLTTMFVFSLTEVNSKEHPRDNLYMWSHYGKGHRGIALEFDSNLLVQSCQKQTEKPYENPLIPIEYGDLPKLTPEDIYEWLMLEAIFQDDLRGAEINWLETGIMQKTDRQFRTKAKIWEKESEWRLIRKIDGTKLEIDRCNLLDNAVTAVYLGCRVDGKTQETVIFETKKNFPHAKIYKSKPALGEFALEFEEVN